MGGRLERRGCSGHRVGLRPGSRAERPAGVGADVEGALEARAAAPGAPGQEGVGPGGQAAEGAAVGDGTLIAPIEVEVHGSVGADAVVDHGQAVAAQTDAGVQQHLGGSGQDVAADQAGGQQGRGGEAERGIRSHAHLQGLAAAGQHRHAVAAGFEVAGRHVHPQAVHVVKAGPGAHQREVVGLPVAVHLEVVAVVEGQV